MDEVLRRFEVPAEEVKVGEWRQVGRGSIRRVNKVGPVYRHKPRGGIYTAKDIDHRYVRIDCSYLKLEDPVVVWR